ncbi:MAG: adenylate/guanylate cyclase domain-containing protein [Burkholderiales bacterium]
MNDNGIAALVAFVARGGLGDMAETDLLAGLCERLNAAGAGIFRAAIGGSMLDPVFDARGLRWKRESGASQDDVPRDADPDVPDGWTHSPFRVLAEQGREQLRRRVGVDYVSGEFPLVDELVQRGVTDYAAFLTRGAGASEAGAIDGMVSSWTTDAAGGFTDAHFELIAAILPTLALAFVLRTTRRTARTLVTTYLGSDAAERVLAGNIVRGRAEPLRAVVWFSDLAGFTRISESLGAEGTLALLNEYAEVQVDAIEAHGGHVLKFIGDGLLAIFPEEGTVPACTRALDAAVDHRLRIAALRDRRRNDGLPVVDAHVALHRGDLLYGNLGSPRRLDFTVLGPAVNEAARIEALCGSLDQKVVVSWAFAEAAGDARSRLVSLGRYALKGVARPQEMFTLDVP